MTSPLHTKMKELRELSLVSPYRHGTESDSAHSEETERLFLALISALEKAIVALDIYSTQHFESCSLSCSKYCDCGLTYDATKALAEIAAMLEGK